MPPWPAYEITLCPILGSVSGSLTFSIRPQNSIPGEKGRWRLLLVGSGNREQVGEVDADGLNPDPYLPVRGFRNRNVRQPERLTMLLHQHRFHH